MSIMESDNQWFIARDGRQHGPVSDLEMRKLVELGHLRPTDLIWRQGFADWRPAPAVFPTHTPTAMPAARPVSAPPRARPATQTSAPRYEPTAGRQAQPAGLSRSDFGPAPAAAGAMRAPGPAIDRGEAGFGLAREQPLSLDPRSTAERGPAPGPVRGDDTPPRRRVGPALAVLTLLGLVAGGGWLALKNYDKVKALVDAQVTKKPSQQAAAGAPEPAKAPEAAAAVTPTQGDIDALDARLQAQPHWKLVRQDFSDWYRRRLEGGARLIAEKKPEAELNQYLAVGLMELRRANADKALAASTAKLQAIAGAFQKAIAHLGQQGSDVCLDFITKGEASLPVADMLAKPEQHPDLSAHVSAIVVAAAEGAKSPTAHADTSDADYQALVSQLVKSGWSQADLELFADPKGVTRTTPVRYCKMMQDFMAAHLAVPDPAVQERLLYRTLKLVVSG